MYAVGRLSSYISQGVSTVSAPFTPFGGAVDIIVVEQPDGSFKSSPWYVKFGKFQGVLKTREKIVNITINGNDVDFHMYLDHTGEAYFVREEDVDEIDSAIFSSPFSGDEAEADSRNGRVKDSKQPSFDSPINVDNENIMLTADSRQSGMFGLLFGRKSMKKNNKEGGGAAIGRVSSLESAEIAADLLDVKWSTNLPIDTPRKHNRSKLSVPVEEPDKGDQVNGSILAHDTMESHFDHPFGQESCPCNGEMGNSSNSGIADTDNSNGVDGPAQNLQCEERDKDKGDQVNGSILAHDTMESHFDHPFVQESCPCNMEMGNSSNSGVADTDSSNGVDGPTQNLQCEERDKDKGEQVNGSILAHDTMETHFDHPFVQESCPCNVEMGNSSNSGVADTDSSNGVDGPAQNLQCEERYKDKGDQVNGSILAHDTMETHFDHPFVQESCTCNVEMGNSSNSGVADTDSSNGVDGPAQNLQCAERDKDTSMSVTSVSEEKLELLSETSTKIGKFDLEAAIVEDREESELETRVPFMQGSCTDSITGVSDERVNLSGVCFSNEESENSFVPEVNSQPECATLVDKINLNELKLPKDEDSGKFLNSNLAVESTENSFLEDTRNHVMESQFPFGIHVVTSDSGETEILELNHKQTITETLDEGMTGQTELVEACENHSQLNGFSNPSSAGSTEASLEEPSTEPESHAQTTEDNLVHLVEEAESLGVSISSSQSHSARLDHEEGNLGEYNEENNPHSELDINNDPLQSSMELLSTKTDLSNSLSENSEEDQFLFSDVDDFITNGVQIEDSAFPDPLEIENDPLVAMTGVEDLNGSGNMDDKSPMEDSTTKSSPMSIPRSRACADEEVEWMIESLPNLRSHIENLEISEALHPLSHSFDSHSEKLREEVLRKDVSCSSTSDLDPSNQLADTDPTIKDKRIWEEFKNLSTTSTVEISLCKHMLYEGMGADAASQAFDAERVDLEKCASLGPQFLKNDNLIVRIGGRYFPWDAAASYIAEMLSLGHDQSFEPQGMIAVHRVEKTIDGETPRSSVPSGGSWTIWPFSRRRSRSMTSVQAALEGSNSSDSLNTSERFDDATTNKNSPIVEDDATINKNLPLVKVAKTKVKSIVPTSEQLATLNLKEGRNVIAFTFSTAMLGKQQVDANIYLWKWNTRIVVSDVDGTITRSDVLGQFMPLVGKDWSHIGVTHLFTAIKENGYKLLFLSARSISQAYLTRQFLFNLKQDGKALPEGPVVISPDGLFPSLFREVIRRAPHEFKIACLEDIRALFPPDCSPFYAGFGNRITDEISYRKLGIPKGKIFIINPKGEVAVNRRFDRKSYTSLHALVDGMFPARTSVEQEDFNSWNYWKMPLPDINS